MSANIIGVKSQLAKLMATENITVQHSNVQTASFNVKSRVLTLPFWKDITNEMYDLLVGHEVGHAIDTPHFDRLKTSYKEVCDDEAISHTFINVVEDARIEKLIKRRYPGLRRQFAAGYNELLKRDFFEIKGRSFSEFGFMDRINLFFKLGQAHAVNVPFSNDEMPFVKRIENVETFDEVVAICKDIYEFLRLRNERIMDVRNMDTMVGEEDADGPDTGKLTVEKNTENTSDKSDDKSDDKSVDKSVDKEENEQSAATGPGAGRSNSLSDTDNLNDDLVDKFIAETYNAMSEATKDIVDKSAKTREYVNIPTIKLDEVLVPHKRLHADLRNYYARFAGDKMQKLRESLKKFKDENNNVVSYMLREFEAKKAADEYARTSVARTGVIDVNRLYTHKYNDDIFARKTIEPGAKNHGVVMFFDMSGSMHPHYSGTIEQLIVLSLFCRRAQIPFEVYGFSDNPHNPIIQEQWRRASVDISHLGKGITPYFSPGRVSFTTLKVNDVLPSPFALKQYLTSSMTATEYNEALLHLWVIAKHFGGSATQISVPLDEQLTGTPLSETIIAAREVVEAFKAKTKAQIVSTIFLTDGDAARMNFKINIDGNTASVEGADRVVFADRKTGYQYGEDQQSSSLLKALGDYTGSRVIGFFLAPSYMIPEYCRQYNVQNYENVVKKQNFVTITAAGYDKFFVVKSSAMKIEDEEMADAKSRGMLAKNFTKYLRKKTTNRVLLSQLITMISA